MIKKIRKPEVTGARVNRPQESQFTLSVLPGNKYFRPLVETVI